MTQASIRLGKVWPAAATAAFASQVCIRVQLVSLVKQLARLAELAHTKADLAWLILVHVCHVVQESIKVDQVLGLRVAAHSADQEGFSRDSE